MFSYVVTVLMTIFTLEVDPAVEGCQKDIQTIDQQVEKLEKEKEKHIKLARMYQKKGDQWQYSTGRIEDAHEAWGKADDERGQAIKLQHQIDLLLQRKDRILQFYPELQQ